MAQGKGSATADFLSIIHDKNREGRMAQSASKPGTGSLLGRIAAQTQNKRVPKKKAPKKKR